MSAEGTEIGATLGLFPPGRGRLLASLAASPNVISSFQLLGTSPLGVPLGTIPSIPGLVQLTVLVPTAMVAPQRTEAEVAGIGTSWTHGETKEDVPDFSTARATLPKAAGEEATHDTCGICLQQFENGERLTALPCAHETCPSVWHEYCIRKWLCQGHSLSCPLCRSVIDSGEPGASSSTAQALPAQAMAVQVQMRSLSAPAQRPSEAEEGRTDASARNLPQGQQDMVVLTVPLLGQGEGPETLMSALREALSDLRRQTQQGQGGRASNLRSFRGRHEELPGSPGSRALSQLFAELLGAATQQVAAMSSTNAGRSARSQQHTHESGGGRNSAGQQHQPWGGNRASSSAASSWARDTSNSHGRQQRPQWGWSRGQNWDRSGWSSRQSGSSHSWSAASSSQDWRQDASTARAAHPGSGAWHQSQRAERWQDWPEESWEEASGWTWDSSWQWRGNGQGSGQGRGSHRPGRL